MIFAGTFYFTTATWIARDITRLLIAWDAGVLLFLALSLAFMCRADDSCMKRRAIAHDER